ncbi:MAG: amidase, partial [Cyanobacteria bacterium K_DeepCast_35m_m2_023]|nr:amidase [Cyanobacteria bacterium K_DeepCast_35m_m2_023]
MRVPSSKLLIHRRPARRLWRLSLAASLLLMPGCRADEQPRPSPLHWPAPAPPPALDPAHPRLWIALASRLGAQDEAAPLVLRSASGSLILRDGSGQSWRAPQIILRWQRQPLAEPFELRRLVVGPYASFETAERVAQSWRQRGVPAVLAQPADWEVWAPAQSPLPPGLTARLWQQRVSAALVPVLALPGQPPRSLQGPLLLEASA